MRKKIIFLLLCGIFALKGSLAYSDINPTYTLVAKNFNRSAPDSIVFDIYMLHTNPSATNFEYSLGQYFFKFNNAIANGGTLTYKILESGLTANAVPRNPTVTGDELRLASNPVIGAGNGPIISSTLSGTLIVRMSLKTSAPAFAGNQNLNLTWKNSNLPAPFSKVFAYIGSTSTEITTPETHFIEDLVSINPQTSEIPDKFSLNQNYPNPFNPSTKISFDLPKSEFVSLKIFDVSGKEVADLVNEKLSAGKYEFQFNAVSLASGVYFYKLNSVSFTSTMKMVLLK